MIVMSVVKLVLLLYCNAFTLIVCIAVFAKGLIAAGVLSMMVTHAVVFSNCVHHVASKLSPPPLLTETCYSHTC